MKELYKKYPSLQGINIALVAIDRTRSHVDMNDVYKKYKSLISEIGCLTPSEYDLCIKWFCDTMEY